METSHLDGLLFSFIRSFVCVCYCFCFVLFGELVSPCWPGCPGALQNRLASDLTEILLFLP